jgi:hypothetical protein
MHASLQLRGFLQITGAASFFGANAPTAAEEIMKMFDSDWLGSTRMSLQYGQCFLMLASAMDFWTLKSSAY